MWVFGHRPPVCDVMWCRLQQLTEFDCFVKSFTYLAARLPRSEFLEPFLDDAIVEPVESIKKRVVLLRKMKELNLSETLDIDENAFMQGIQLATGKPSEAVLQAGDVPLSEAEPDMYPCLLASCGSSFIFLKVIYADFRHRSWYGSAVWIISLLVLH